MVDKLLLYVVLHLMIASCSSTRPTLPGKVVNETPTWIKFSPDSKYIAAGITGGVRVWNVQSEDFKDYKTKLPNETPEQIIF